MNFSELYNFIHGKLLHEDITCFVTAFGLYHVVHIMLHESDDIESPALYLELLKAHRHVFFPYFISRDEVWRILYLENAPVHELTFSASLAVGVVGEKHIVLVRIFRHMTGIGYLFLADGSVMGGAVGTFRFTAGIDQYLAFFLVGYLFQSLEIMVEVIVDNNNVIILFHFGIKPFSVGYTLAGGTGYLIIVVVFPDIFFQKRRSHDDLIEAVIGEAHYHIAVFIMEVFFFKDGICECKAQGDIPVIEHFYDLSYEPLIASAELKASAVPHGRGESSVNRSYLHTFTEEIGTMLQHFRKGDIEHEMLGKPRKMESD